MAHPDSGLVSPQQTASSPCQEETTWLRSRHATGVTIRAFRSSSDNCKASPLSDQSEKCVDPDAPDPTSSIRWPRRSDHRRESDGAVDRSHRTDTSRDRSLDFFKFCREMPQCRRRIDDPEPSQRFALSIHFHNGFHDIIDVALSVDTTWNCQADQLHTRM